MTETTRSEFAYFDALVAEKGEFDPFAERAWRTLAKRFESFVPTSQPIDVLDIGCGTGQSRQLYIDQARRYVGIDLSSTAIALANQKFPQDQWQVADATQLPFGSDSFDVVAFSSVLHHIPDYTRALREAERVLRPGGYAFAFDPNLLHPAMALIRWPSSPLYSQSGVSPNERPLLPWDLRRAFRDAGFVNLKQRCQADIPYRHSALPLPKLLVRLYNGGDWVTERIGLGRLFGSFIVTCGRKTVSP